MVAPLDVFAVNNGEPRWLGCAQSLAQAIDLLRESGSGSYFVFSQQTGHKNFYDVTVEGVVVSQVSASA